jgi:ABC-type molybdate transport system permease subunit
MTILYQIITTGVIVLVGWNLFRERRLVEQMAAALVLLPLILRVLMIK